MFGEPDEEQQKNFRPGDDSEENKKWQKDMLWPYAQEEEKEQNKNTFSPRSGKLELPPSQPGACESGVRACPGPRPCPRPVCVRVVPITCIHGMT